MKRAALIALLLVGLGAHAEQITLEQALDTAREHHPALQQARAGVEQARARSDQARAPLLPLVNFTAGYSRSTANFVARPGSVPNSLAATAAPTFAGRDFFNAGLNASQLVWDFQTFDRWKAAQSSALSQEDQARVSLLDTLTEVRTRYFAVRAAQAMVQVAKETLENQERHLQQVKGFVEVGTRAEIDLAQSQTDRANAKVQLITAENTWASSKALLNQAMGIERDTAYDVLDQTSAPVESEDAPLQSLLDSALATRPEMAAVQAQIEAQRRTLSATRGDYYPALVLTAQATEQGPAPSQMTWNMGFGAALSWNLFSGLSTEAQTREQSAALTSLEAQAALTRQSLRVQVEQAQLGVRAARAALEASGEALKAAQERLRLAEGRYQTGVGNIIELGDAQLAHNAAAAQRVQAEYQLATARVQLLRALGRD